MNITELVAATRASIPAGHPAGDRCVYLTGNFALRGGKITRERERGSSGGPGIVGDVLQCCDCGEGLCVAAVTGMDAPHRRADN